MVSILDFDQTLSINHSFHSFHRNTQFFDAEGNPGLVLQALSDAFKDSPERSDQLIALMSGLSDHPIRDETWKKLGKLHASINLKAGIPIERLSPFAIASHHNNPDFIAGYLEVLLGKPLTPITEEPKLSGEPQVAIKRFQIAEQAEPLCICYLPDVEPQAYQAKRAALDNNKNHQIQFLRETMGLVIFRPEDPFRLEPGNELASENDIEHRVTFYDDDANNCKQAMRAGLVDEALQVSRSFDYLAAPWQPTAWEAIENINASGAVFKGLNDAEIRYVLAQNQGKVILRPSSQPNDVTMVALLGDTLWQTRLSGYRDFYNQLAKARTPASALSILDGRNKSVLRPEDIKLCLLKQRLFNDACVYKGTDPAEIQRLAQNKILLRASSQAGEVSVSVKLEGVEQLIQYRVKGIIGVESINQLNSTTEAIKYIQRRVTDAIRAQYPQQLEGIEILPISNQNTAQTAFFSAATAEVHHAPDASLEEKSTANRESQKQSGGPS